MKVCAHYLLFTLILAMPYAHGMEVDNDNDDVKPEIFEYESAVTALEFENDSIIVTGHENGDVNIRKEGDFSLKGNQESRVSTLCFAGSKTYTEPDGYDYQGRRKYKYVPCKVFITGSENGTICSNEFEQPKNSDIASSIGRKFAKSVATHSPVTVLDYDTKNRTVLSGHFDGTIRCFTRGELRLKRSWSTDSAVLALRMHRLSHRFGTGHQDGLVRIWSQKKGCVAATKFNAAIVALAFNPTKNDLVVGHQDGNIHVCSFAEKITKEPGCLGTKTKKSLEINHIREINSESDLLKLDFNPNGTSFATGHPNGIVQIWSSSEPNERIATLESPSKSDVTTLNYNPSGTYLLVGRTNKTLSRYHTFALLQKHAQTQRNNPSSTVDKSEKEEIQNEKEEKNEDEQLPPPYNPEGFNSEYPPTAPPFEEE